MNKKGKSETVSRWEEIEKRVLKSFNLDEVGVIYAVSRWREHVERARGVVHAGEVTHQFTSPKVLDAVVKSFKADIAENNAIFLLNLARNDRLLKQTNLRVALGEAQGVFVDEERGEHIVPEMLAVLRVTKSAKMKMLQQVVQASMTLARSNGDENAEEPSWPVGLGEGIQDFANDLTEFINTNGEQGRQMVTRVCEDHEFARRVRNNEEMPKPLRFLAQVVVEASTNIHLPEKERRIGFGFGSR